MKKFLTALAILAGFCLAENPICSNKDKSMAFYHKCFAFNDFQFLSFYESYPSFSNGESYQDSGSVSFEKYARLADKSTTFEKKGITYKRYPKAQYTCDYEVLEKKDVEDDFNIEYTDIKYVVSYGCEYQPINEFDTAFAETEFQRMINAEELILKSLAKEFTEIELWKFYRKDGTLKFSGDEHGGYCMSANGMKKTKRVTSPAYCN